jgi:predicted dehydrogenase
MKTIRWGILGTGGIARKFAEGLQQLPDAQLVSVGSRTRAAADAFGDAWKIPRRHGSYKELAADPETDVIYIATIHPLHYENCIDCLTAGKAVLCEKPFTINAAQAKEVIERAREKKIFLMEAMWTRYFPVFDKIRELIAQGALGEIRMVDVDFAFRPPVYDPKSRIYDRALGGGALMDIGIYPVSLASMVFGEFPRRILSSAVMGRTGVDEQAAVILEYSGERQASITFSFRYDSPQEAHIIGSEGRIRIHRSWWYPSALTFTHAGKDEVFTLPYQGNGYPHEAVEVMECLRAGRTESRHMPLDETLRIMRTLDAIRSEWGLKYPGD